MAHNLEIAGFYVIEGKGSEFLAIGLGASDNIQCGTIEDGIFAGFDCISVEGGQYLICDDCNEDIGSDDACYYVSVLNRLLCHKCFTKWIGHAKHYSEDVDIEVRNYSRHQKLLEREGLWNPDEQSDFIGEN